MKRLLMIFISSAALFLAACNAATFEEEETYTLDATGIEHFVIQQDAGEVIITGVEGTNEIKVSAKFVAESDEAILAEQIFADKMDATLVKDGNTAYLTGEINFEESKEQGQLHLVVEIPNDLTIEHRQSEGPLTIRSMNADITINHGTKSIVLEDINGDVKIVDGSGGLKMTNVVGLLTINKNSGNIEMRDVDGDLTLIAGSADVNITSHRGNITLRSGSGDVIIDGVDGDVNLLASRKGTVEITNVTGTVTKPE